MPPGLYSAPGTTPFGQGMPSPAVAPANPAGQHILAMLGRPASSSQIPTSTTPTPTTPSGNYPQMPVYPGYSNPMSTSSAPRPDQLRASGEMRVPSRGSDLVAVPSSPIPGSPLKKSVSATLETASFVPQGVHLQGDVTISRSEHRARCKKPLEVNQITIYSQPDVSFKLGSSISVNNHFICYVVKRTPLCRLRLLPF